MKKIRSISLLIAVLVFALSVAACSPKLDEDVAAVARDYYTYVILRQDYVTVNDKCAYDRVAMQKIVYTNRAEEEGKTLEEYIDSLAESRGLQGDIATHEDFLKALSDNYVNSVKESGNGAKFDATPEIVSFSDAKNLDIQSVYDSLDAQYHREGVYIVDYLDYDSITDAKFVTVGVDGNNTQVLIVKIGDQWLYLA